MNRTKLTRKEKLEARKKNPQPEVSSKKAGSSQRKIDFAGVFIALLAFALYLNTFQNDFALDDISAIQKNWVVKQGTSSFGTILSTSYRYGYRDSGDELYRPLPLMVFATLWQYFPDNPAPFHFLNVLLYALTGYILYKVLKKIFRGFNPLLCFIASVLFIVHPLHTEVVANIKSIDEILSFLFVLLTINHLFKYIEKSSVKSLIISWLFFFLAFLSKEGTIVMLAVIPLILVMFTEASKGKISMISLVLASAAFIFIAMRMNALGGLTVGKKFLYIENVLVKAPDIWIRFATIFYVLSQYIRLMVLPYPLSCDYSFKELDLVSWSDPVPWLSLFFYAGLIFIAIRNFKRSKIISFAILFFLGTISLYSNILMTIGTLFAERFLYAPLLGFTLIIAWLVLKIFKISFVEEGEGIFQKKYRSSLILTSVLVIPCCLLTTARNRDWKNTVQLFSRDIVNSPNSALLNYNYANELKIEMALKAPDVKDKNRYLDSSIVHYKKAIELYPTYVEAHEQLGLAYYYRGMDSAAFGEITKAIELDPGKSTAYNSLGTLYFEKANDYKKAMELFQKSVEINPNYIDGWRNVGCTYGTTGQYEKAMDAFKVALRLDPANADVLNFMAQTYRSMGDDASADSYARKADEIKSRRKKQN